MSEMECLRKRGEGLGAGGGLLGAAFPHPCLGSILVVFGSATACSPDTPGLPEPFASLFRSEPHRVVCVGGRPPYPVVTFPAHSSICQQCRSESSRREGRGLNAPSSASLITALPPYAHTHTHTPNTHAHTIPLPDHRHRYPWKSIPGTTLCVFSEYNTFDKFPGGLF